MRRPWFSYYVDDFELNSKVRLMTAEEEGCYHRLLRYQWRNGSIPDKMTAVAEVCRQPTRRMSRLWATLEPCFPLVNGLRKNPRMEKERVKAEKISAARSEAVSKRYTNESDLKPVCKPPCVSQVTSHKKKVIRETWLTSFGRIWEKAYDGEPPWGRLGAALGFLRDRHSNSEILAHWEQYCGETPGQYASVERFKNTYGSWKPKQGLKELPDPLKEEG